MALGTALAIGLGASALGGVASSMSASSAAKKAAKGQQAAADNNNALTRDIYNQNKSILAPNIASGNTAGSYLNAFLGLPSGGGSGGGSGGSGLTDWAAYVNGNPDALANWNAIKDTSSGARFGGDMAAFGQFHYNDDGAHRDLSPYNQGGVTSGVTQADAQNAFGSYLKNSDYGFQFATGTNALNSGYAGAGSLQSGAAMKGLEQYRQNLQSGYRNEYLGNLGNQQAVGLSAGSALAGVGQNYVNTISNNNNQAANAMGNAALIKGQNNPFANALGVIGGGLIGVGR